MTIALLAGLPKLGLGLYQAIKGYSSDEPTRPEMKTPQSVTTATKLAQDQANNVLLPGQAGIEGNLDQQTANILQNIERMGGDVNMASRAYGQNLGAKTNLGIKAADTYASNQRRLQEQLDRQGQYEARNFEYNQALPYQEKMKQISALKGAGLTNTSESLTDMLKSYGIFDMINKNPNLGDANNTTGNNKSVYDILSAITKSGASYDNNSGAFKQDPGSLMDSWMITPFVNEQ